MVQQLLSKPFWIVLFNYVVGFAAVSYEYLSLLLDSIIDVSESGILSVLEMIAPVTGFFSFIIGTLVGLYAIRNLHLKNRNENIRKRLLEKELQEYNERED